MNTTSTDYYVYIGSLKVLFPMSDGELEEMMEMMVPVANEPNTFRLLPEYQELMASMIDVM